MPSKSKSQQRLFGMVHALKQGKLDPNDLSAVLADKVKDVAGSISSKAAKDFAKTKVKNKPERVQETLTFKDFLQQQHDEFYN